MEALLGWLGGFDWTALSGAVFGFLFDQLRAELAQLRAEQALRDLGRTEAERDGLAVVVETADQQAAHAANPQTDDELLGRLDGGKA